MSEQVHGYKPRSGAGSGWRSTKIAEKMFDSMVDEFTAVCT